MTLSTDNLTLKIDGLEHAVKGLQAHNEQLEADKQALGAKCAELAQQLENAEQDSQTLSGRLEEARNTDGVINAAAGKVQALTEAITSSLPAS